MKKNIVIIILFIFIALFGYNVLADNKISSLNVGYKKGSEYISVKQRLDELILDTKDIKAAGNAVAANILSGKTGFSKGVLITGTMPNRDDTVLNISSIWKDGERIKFYFPEIGYYSNATSLKMTFGNLAQFYIEDDGYYDKTSIMSVPSSEVLTLTNLKGDHVDIKNTSGTVIDKIYMEYSKTNTFVVSPKTGYYISGVSCNNDAHKITGYTVGDNETGWGSQTLTITNNSKEIDTTCTILTEPREFTVTFSGSYVTASPTSIKIKYGSTSTVTLTNDSRYYFESMSCTNGYTTNLSTGTGYYAAQTVTISNNSNVGDSACTIGMHSRSYAASWNSRTCYSYYSCNCTHEYCWDGKGELTTCNEHCDECHSTYDCGNYYCPYGGSLSGSTCSF